MAQMPMVFDNPDHWHARALQAPALADNPALADKMTDTERRERTLAIAREYDRPADRAVGRLKTNVLANRVSRVQ
jgi:hypothetical protein